MNLDHELAYGIQSGLGSIDLPNERRFRIYQHSLHFHISQISLILFFSHYVHVVLDNKIHFFLFCFRRSLDISPITNSISACARARTIFTAGTMSYGWSVHKSLCDIDIFWNISQLLTTGGRCFKFRISQSYLIKLLSYNKFPSCHHHHQGTILESCSWQIQSEAIKVAGESGNSL